MVYPVVVILVAVGILTFIMILIIPKFEKIFEDFGIELPAITHGADRHLRLSWSTTGTSFPSFPIGVWLFDQADPQVQDAAAWAGT